MKIKIERSDGRSYEGTIDDINFSSLSNSSAITLSNVVFNVIYKKHGFILDIGNKYGKFFIRYESIQYMRKFKNDTVNNGFQIILANFTLDYLYNDSNSAKASIEKIIDDMLDKYLKYSNTLK